MGNNSDPSSFNEAFEQATAPADDDTSAFDQAFDESTVSPTPDPNFNEEFSRQTVGPDDEETGTPALGPNDADLEEAGEPDRSVGRLVHGLGQFVEGAAEPFVENIPKTVAFLAENTALGGAPKPPTAEEVKDQSFGEWLFGSDEDIEQMKESPAWRLGDEMGRQLEEVFPENPEYRDEFLANALPQSAGNLMGIVGAGAVSGGSTFGVTAALGASDMAPRAFERAKAEGASDQQAMASFYTHLGIGGLEAIPISRSLQRIEKTTGGALSTGLRKAIGRTGANTVEGVLEEGIQEAISTTLSNASTKAIYDKSRALLENVPESAALGGILGGSLNAVGTSLNSKLAQAETTQEVAEVSESRDLLRQQIDRARRKGKISEEEARQYKQQYTDQDIRKGGLGAQDPSDVDPNQKTLDALIEEGEETWTDKFFNWARGNLEEKAFQPQRAKELEVRWGGRLDKEVAKAKRNIDRVNRAVQEELAGMEEAIGSDFFGSDAENSIPRGMYEDITKVMRGDKEYKALPEGVRGPVRRMRNHIDRLSNELINKGVVEGELQAKIKRNIGTYVTRAYRKDSKAIDWELSDVPEHIRTSAAAHIKKQYRQTRGKEPTEKDVKGIMEELLNLRDIDQDFGKAVNKSRLDWGPLKKREDFPEPIRALWGEYTDGTLAYAKTIEKVSNLVHGYDYYNKLRSVGLKEGWLVDPENSEPGDIEGMKRVAPEGSRVQEPVAGLMAEPRVAEALKGVEEIKDQSKLMEIYTRINGGMKFAATAANQITHVRNFAGGTIMQAKQGVNPFSPSRAADAYRTIKADLGVKGPADKFLGKDFEVTDGVEARIDRLRELQIIDQSVRGGDLLGVLADASRAGSDKSFVDRVTYHKNKEEGALHRAAATVRRTGERLGQIYQAEDNFHRIMYWMAEADRFSKAFHDKPFSELEGQQKRRIEEYAGNLVRRNYQNYGQVPDAIKKLRRQPWFGTFVSYPYEVMRTTANTLRTGYREINHSNPDVQKIGYKRLASTALVSSGVGASTAAAGMTAMYGVGMAAQEMEDLKEFIAPWDKEGALGMVNKNGMEYEYINFTYLNPDAMFGEPIRAWATSENPLSTEAVGNFAESLSKQFEPFYSPDLLTQKVVQAAANENEWGAPIYPEAGSLGRIAGDLGAHFFEGVTPQLLKSQLDIAEAYGFDMLDEPGSEDPDVDNTWLGAMGLRVTKVDTEKSFEIQASEFSEHIRNSRYLLNEVKYREGASFGEKLDAMDDANEAYRGEAEKFLNKIDAVYRLGLDQDEIKKKMVDAGVPKDETETLLRGFPGRVVDVEDLEE